MNNQPIQTSASGGEAAQRTEKRVGAAVFFVVLLAYALKAPTFAVPGRWAGIIASFTGLDPFRPLIRPLWSTLLWILSLLHLPNLGYVVNLFSALAGAAVCWLLYASVVRIPFSRSFRRREADALERVPRLLAGVFAAAFAAVSLPMIMVSTRGDFAVLDILLMVASVYPAVQYMARPQVSRLYQSWFLFGLAIVEYPSMVYVAPGFFAWWGYLLWKTKIPPVSVLVSAAAMLGSGLLVLFFATALYSGSYFAEVRALTEPSAVLGQYFRLYFGELTQSVPKVGWLLIIGMNLVPFVVVMFKELQEPTDRFTAVGVYAFRFVLFGLAVLTLFSLPGSPAKVLGPRVLLLAPSIVVAAWFGYLVGYYYGLFSQARKAALAKGFAIVWAVVLLFAGFRHAVETRVGHLAPIQDFARQVVEGMGNRVYLVTDGSLDPTLLLAAQQVGERIHVINLQSGQSADAGRYYAGMFDDPALKGLATMGARPLLRGWLSRDPGAADRIALLVPPDALSAGGFTVMPSVHAAGYVAQDRLPDPAALFSEFEAAWADLKLPSLEGLSVGDTGWFQSMFIVRWVSRQANDLGFYLEQSGQADLAAEAYRKSIELWPENVSAALNLREQARREKDKDAEEQWSAVLTQMAERNPGAFSVAYLIQYCGSVRDPAALIAEASSLIKAGGDDAALNRINQAAGLMGDKGEDQQYSLAQFHLRNRNYAQAEAIYQRLLTGNEGDLDALYGLLQVYMLQKKTGESRAVIERMRANGASEDRLLMDSALVELSAGNLPEAKRILGQVTREPGAPTEAWFSLAQIAIQEKDEDALTEALAMLERDRQYLPGLLLLGERALLQNRTDDARGYFLRALELSPGNEQVLVRLIQFDFRNRDASSLRIHVGALLAVNPDHAYANFMSAYLHIDAKEYGLAETALRRSLAQKDHGDVRNELAWVLHEQNRDEEALEHAEKAIQFAPGNANFHDTLAAIQFALGQTDQALVSQEKALSLSGRNDPAMLIHAVKIYMSAGKPRLAADALADARAMEDRLTQEDRREIESLSKMVER